MNSNIAFNLPTTTPPNFQGGQGVMYPTNNIVAPSTGVQGGLSMFTDGAQCTPWIKQEPIELCRVIRFIPALASIMII